MKNKNINWQKIAKLFGRQLTKSEADKLIKYAHNEIEEWQQFILEVKMRIKN